MRSLFTIALFLFTSTFLSCGSTSKPYPQVTAYKYHGFNYELQVKYHVKGRGNAHTLSLAKYEFDVSDWIYLNSLQGKIEADSLVLTYEQQQTDEPWKRTNIKGNVIFIGDTAVKINLQLPTYNDGDSITGYFPYERNGTYALLIKNDTSLYNRNL